MTKSLPESEGVRIRETLALLPPAPGRILEVGCGDGRLLDRLPCVDAVGLDVDGNAIKLAQRRTIQGSANALPFGDRSFDTVLCAEVLEHLPDAIFGPALSELQRVARHTIVVTVPWREDLAQARTRCNACGAVIHLSGHVRAFTRRRLAAAFQRFKPVCVRTFGRRSEPESYVFARLIRYLAGRWPVPARVVACPTCGSADLGAEGRPRLTRLIAGLHWRWCALRRATCRDYWFGMRLERR